MRAGLTGLGLVFVATLGASVLFGTAQPERVQEPGEPLAQLGVAPGPDKFGDASPDRVADVQPEARSDGPPALLPDAALSTKERGTPPPQPI